MQTLPLEDHGQIPETELVSRAIRKDERAVRELIRRYNRRLYRLARSVIRDDNEAEDILQEAYLRAFNQLSSFRGASSLGTSLGRIVLNEALGRVRRRRPLVELAETRDYGAPHLIPFPLTNLQIDPEHAVAQREIHSILELAVDKLPDDFRTVLVARTIDGMSIEETAELLDLNPKTVKTRLHRARKLLKDDVAKQTGSALSEIFPFDGWRCARLTNKVIERLKNKVW